MVWFIEKLWIVQRARENLRKDTAFLRESAADVARLAEAANKDLRHNGLRLIRDAFRGHLVLTEAGERGVKRLFHLFGLSAAALGLYVGITAAMGYTVVALSAAYLELVFMLASALCALLLRRQRLPPSRRIEYRPAEILPPQSSKEN